MEDIEKVEEAKNIMDQYGDLLMTKKEEYDSLKEQMDALLSEFQKIPSVVRNRFVKDETVLRLLNEYKNQHPKN